jgi:RNA polymerase sigma-70 factor, ECF subfamily
MRRVPQSGTDPFGFPFFLIITDESKILADILAGDTDQFGLLYDAYAERIYRYHFYRTRDRAAAEDLTSTTFFKAIGNIKKFDPAKGAFGAWLYRIARNTLFDHSRARRRTEPIDGDGAAAVASPEDLERNAISRELAENVRRSFAELSADQREVVTLRVWDELSYPEIAKVVGRSEASCKMAFYRAAQKLRALAPMSIVFAIVFGSIVSRQ